MSDTPNEFIFREVPSTPISNLLFSCCPEGKEKLAVVKEPGSKTESDPIVVPEIEVSVTL